MNRLDFAPLYRSTVGFDRLLRLLDSASSMDSAGGYPPYNIEKAGDNQYRISVAVAGFGPDYLTVEVNDSVLTVSGRKSSEDDPDNIRVLHQGIAARNFERRFQLADHVVVTNAGLENGLLNIDLVREIPESQKPRRIEIREGSAPAPVIENKAAAA